jgi:Xaa-Pro aminopeptidase
MTEFAKRRKTFMQQMSPTSLAILPAAAEKHRSGDVLYPYRQQSDFYYLTGFEEPEAIAVLAPKRQEGEYVLFNRVRDHHREIWDGPRAGLQGACHDFLADQAFSIHEFKQILPLLLTDRDSIYYSLGIHHHFDQLILEVFNHLRAQIRSGMHAPITFIDIAPTIHEMRLLKSKTEITCMQNAVDISSQAHLKLMEICQPDLYEYQLEAEFTYACQRRGARYHAYPPIIGAGKNSCILHYINNNQKIAKGDLVLIDAGAEYQNYAADITRTLPANGQFSGEQRAIYELVLTAQLAAIQSIKPGALWTTAQHIIIPILTQGLVDLGILKGRVDNLIEKEAYLPFYMHKSGHWLGLDVHDTGLYKVQQKWRPLQSGMVLTVEPGLYLSADIKGLHKRWHHIGVRIEDDILVTETSCRVLSQSLPKTIADIEAVMAGS